MRIGRRQRRQLTAHSVDVMSAGGLIVLAEALRRLDRPFLRPSSAHPGR